jgi:hypothetical protein
MILDRVTITGADDKTDPKELLKLSEKYPFVEWAILLSANNGRPRFPRPIWIESLAKTFVTSPTSLSGHLCGRWVRDLIKGVNSFVGEESFISSGIFDRYQLNINGHAQEDLEHPRPFMDALSSWNDIESIEGFIFQMNGINDSILQLAKKEGIKAHPLFDSSGGAGIEPESWPTADPKETYSGYAGGLRPGKIGRQLVAIDKAAGKNRIWIDIETHVRTVSEHGEKDILDLTKVERLLNAVEPHVDY